MATSHQSRGFSQFSESKENLLENEHDPNWDQDKTWNQPPPPPYEYCANTGNGKSDFGFNNPNNLTEVVVVVDSINANDSGDDSDDIERKFGGEFYGIDFTEKTIRRAFIRKVYSILMMQLVVTCGFIALFLYCRPISKWTTENPIFLFITLICSFVMLVVLSASEELRRRSPQNLIILAVFTVLQSVVLGAISSQYSAETVLLAAGITTGICLALTVFSFQTKWDLTMHTGTLYILLVVLFLFGILTIFLRSAFPIANLVYSCLGAMLFSIYLVYDTQMMMGGNHKYSISPEEYVFAALSLYLDIINIFLYILSLLGRRN